MRILVILFILINVWLFALGQGFFGLPPSEQGGSLQPAESKDNAKIQIQSVRQSRTSLISISFLDIAMKPIRKAVFPVAGMGTRFLPATKAMPKEMLPVVDKPLIQYAVEEAIAAGVTELIFVTGRNKRAIEDHFDRAPELEADLKAKHKTELLDRVRNVIPDHIHCIYTRQPAPLGLGHAVLCAAPIVGDEPFLVLLADDLLDAQTPVSRQLVKAAHEHNGSILAIQRVDPTETDKYGVIAGGSGSEHTTRPR